MIVARSCLISDTWSWHGIIIVSFKEFLFFLFSLCLFVNKLFVDINILIGDLLRYLICFYLFNDSLFHIFHKEGVWILLNLLLLTWLVNCVRRVWMIYQPKALIPVVSHTLGVGHTWIIKCMTLSLKINFIRILQVHLLSITVLIRGLTLNNPNWWLC